MTTRSSRSDSTPPSFGDIKKSLQAADHGGWYILDGRGVGALPAGAQANAAGFGLANLPTAGARITRSVGALLSLGGATNNAVVITQANLPAYNMTATSNTSPNTHGHGVNNGTSVWSSPSGTALRAVGTNAGSPQRTGAVVAGGAHTHALTSTQSGRFATPVNMEINALSCNTFIYLGAV